MRGILSKRNKSSIYLLVSSFVLSAMILHSRYFTYLIYSFATSGRERHKELICILEVCIKILRKSETHKSDLFKKKD